MRARIYRPAKTATQSGTARTQHWVLDYAPEKPKTREALMGWTGSDDTREQIKLIFATREEAVAYAQAQNIPYDLEIPAESVIKPKAYADNFRFDRKEIWTH